ncbi:hypothetical protein D3C84_852680 [compost metagenome]
MLQHKVGHTKGAGHLFLGDLQAEVGSKVHQGCGGQLLLAACAGDGAKWRQGAVCGCRVLAAVGLDNDGGHEREMPSFDLRTNGAQWTVGRHISLVGGIGVFGDEWRQQRRAQHQFTTVGAGNGAHWLVDAVQANRTLVSDRDNERSSV